MTAAVAEWATLPEAIRATIRAGFIGMVKGATARGKA